MPKQVTMADARRNWAKVLRAAERGTAVEVTRSGKPVAALVPIETYRRLQSPQRLTVAEAIARFRASVAEGDLAGADPWADVRDRTPGRKFDLGE